MEEKVYPAVSDAASFEAMLARVREAEKKFASYTQEQVDEIFKAAAVAANQARIPLAKMAVAETGMGKQRAFLVTDNFLYSAGYTKPITDKLDEMGNSARGLLQRGAGPDAAMRKGRCEGDGALQTGKRGCLKSPAQTAKP